MHLLYDAASWMVGLIVAFVAYHAYAVHEKRNERVIIDVTPPASKEAP